MGILNEMVKSLRGFKRRFAAGGAAFHKTGPVGSVSGSGVVGRDSALQRRRKKKEM